MTNQRIRFPVLLIIFASAGRAYCDWYGSWSIAANSDAVTKFGPGPNPTSGSVPAGPSLSIDQDLGGDADGKYSKGTVNVDGRVGMNANGKQFGIFGSDIVVDTTPGYAGYNEIESDANLKFFDTLTCITDTNHHRIRMTSYWQINGSLTSDVTGVYSAVTPPAQYVNASARSVLQISGYGVATAPYGGTTWGDSSRSIDSTVTFNPNNYQQDPPKAIPITLYFENNSPELMDLSVTVTSFAFVNNNDYLGPGGSATTVLNLGHTFTWGGITSVTDADTGEAISDWTLTSSSGTDWSTAAVPEPASLLCAASALALLVPCRARRLATSRGLSGLSKN